jgi:hypothetical protein
MSRPAFWVLGFGFGDLLTKKNIANFFPIEEEGKTKHKTHTNKPYIIIINTKQLLTRKTSSSIPSSFLLAKPLHPP